MGRRALPSNIQHLCSNLKLETRNLKRRTLDFGPSALGYLLNNPQSCNILRPQILTDIAVAPGIVRTWYSWQKNSYLDLNIRLLEWLRLTA
jgi:hypothetical protein